MQIPRTPENHAIAHRDGAQQGSLRPDPFPIRHPQVPHIPPASVRRVSGGGRTLSQRVWPQAGECDVCAFTILSFFLSLKWTWVYFSALLETENLLASVTDEVDKIRGALMTIVHV